MKSKMQSYNHLWSEFRFLGTTVVFSLLTTLSLPNLCVAQDHAIVELSDTVTGNQEQPKVLYIVPWQAAQDDTILHQAPKTNLQLDVFQHVERPEHLRQLRYLNQLIEADTTAETN